MWYYTPMSSFEKSLAEFDSKAKNFIKNPDLYSKEVDEVLSLYNSLLMDLLEKKKLPEAVYKFSVNHLENEEIVLPVGYEPLKTVFELYSVIRESASLLIKNSVKSKDYKSAFNLLIRAVRLNIKNIDLFGMISELFIEQELFTELIELYKIEFVYTSNPLCLERVGDVYVKLEDYESALDYYLNCAEVSVDYAQIYIKLADVFGRINDNDSRLACLEHAKKLEGSNGL